MSYPVFPDGNLIADPILKFTEAGNAVCSFRIAISSGKDKPTTFKDCVAFSYLAENIAGSLLKGDAMIIKGRIETSTWEDKSGKEHRKETIIAEKAGPSLQYMDVECNRKKKEDYTGDNKTGGQQTFENQVEKEFPSE